MYNSELMSASPVPKQRMLFPSLETSDIFKARNTSPDGGIFSSVLFDKYYLYNSKEDKFSLLEA